MWSAIISGISGIVGVAVGTIVSVVVGARIARRAEQERTAQARAAERERTARAYLAALRSMANEVERARAVTAYYASMDHKAHSQPSVRAPTRAFEDALSAGDGAIGGNEGLLAAIGQYLKAADGTNALAESAITALSAIRGGNSYEAKSFEVCRDALKQAVNRDLAPALNRLADQVGQELTRMGAGVDVDPAASTST